MSIDPFMRNLEGLLHDLPPGRREDILAVIQPLRRYAALMEQAVAVGQAAFGGADADKVAHLTLEGASRVGNYRAGAFVVLMPEGPMIAATLGEFTGTEGRQAPVEMLATQVSRLAPDRLRAVGNALGITLPAFELYLVPVASPGSYVGTLALLDTDGESPDDRLMDSYASRAAMAYLHAARLP